MFVNDLCNIYWNSKAATYIRFLRESEFEWFYDRIWSSLYYLAPFAGRVAIDFFVYFVAICVVIWQHDSLCEAHTGNWLSVKNYRFAQFLCLCILYFRKKSKVIYFMKHFFVSNVFSDFHWLIDMCFALVWTHFIMKKIWFLEFALNFYILYAQV